MAVVGAATSMNDARLATICVISGMAVIGFVDNVVVLLAEDISLWQFHAMRSFINLCILGIIGHLLRLSIMPKNFWPVLGRSCFFAASMLIYFGCLAFLPIGQVVAGIFTSPILVMLISVSFLGLNVGWIRWLAAFVGFAGILVVIGINPDGFSVVSVFPVLAGLFYAISAIATRSWCEGENTLALLFWFFLTIGVASAVVLGVITIIGQVAPDGAEGFLLRGPTWPSSGTLGWLLVQVAGSLVGVGLLTRAYQIGEASHVAVFEFSLLVFAPLWGWMLFAQVLGMSTLFGMALIVLSGAMITVRSAR